MHGRGHAWQGVVWQRVHDKRVCVAGGHAWQGGMCGRGCVWQGGMHGRGACVVGGVHGCILNGSVRGRVSSSR